HTVTVFSHTLMSLSDSLRSWTLLLQQRLGALHHLDGNTRRRRPMRVTRLDARVVRVVVLVDDLAQDSFQLRDAIACSIQRVDTHLSRSDCAHRRYQGVFYDLSDVH